MVGIAGKNFENSHSARTLLIFFIIKGLTSKTSAASIIGTRSTFKYKPEKVPTMTAKTTTV
jgi:hypothetical protein